MLDFLTSIYPEFLEEAEYLLNNLPFAIWETIYSTVIATVFAYVIGLPLGVILVVGEKGGIRPLPGALMKALNVVINILRSVPFLILMVVVFPLARVIVGTSIGTNAAIVPLTIAAFPFVARLVESSLREMDRGVIEAAQAMGCSPFQIIWKVLLPECLPSLLTGFTTGFITILSYGAMSGAIGGGGLGNMAINRGHTRGMTLVLYVCVIALVVLVQIFQSVGTRLAVRSDKRVRSGGKKRARKEARSQADRGNRMGPPGAV
ncbi:MAG TPA: ABC transporter permease [Candidatus Galloscillospira excrementavium]|nr:ABC transporter permease [Candidatus Galloscillospira excrementavium]